MFREPRGQLRISGYLLLQGLGAARLESGVEGGQWESRFSLTTDRLCGVDRSLWSQSVCDMVLPEPAVASFSELESLRIPVCCVSIQRAHQYDNCQAPKPSHSTSGGATRVVRDQKPEQSWPPLCSPQGWTGSHRVPGNVSARKR